MFLCFFWSMPQVIEQSLFLFLLKPRYCIIVTFLLLFWNLPEHRGLPLHQQGAAPEEPFEKKVFMRGNSDFLSLISNNTLSPSPRRWPPSSIGHFRAPSSPPSGRSRPASGCCEGGPRRTWNSHICRSNAPQKKKWRFFCC